MSIPDSSTDSSPASGSLPDNYREALYWKLTEQRRWMITVNILGSFLMVIFGLIFFAVALSLGKLPLQFKFGPGELGMIILGVSLTLALHELVHGMVMWILGAKPRYGVLWKEKMLYATSPGFAYRRNDYLIIALVPLVVLSLLFVLGMWLLQGTLWVALLAICGTINASGAIGDMWITMIVFRHANTAYVMDERDGVRIFLPKP